MGKLRVVEPGSSVIVVRGFDVHDPLPVLRDGSGHEVGIISVLVGVQRVGGVCEAGSPSWDKPRKFEEQLLFAAVVGVHWEPALLVLQRGDFVSDRRAR